MEGKGKPGSPFLRITNLSCKNVSMRWVSQMYGRLGMTFSMVVVIWTATSLYGGQPVGSLRSLPETYDLYFAQMVDGGGYVTQIHLSNPGGTEIGATLELFQSDGTPFSVSLNGVYNSVFSETIPSHGTLILSTAGSRTESTTGWARVKATGPLGGSLIYRFLSGKMAVAEVGLDPSAAVTRFCFTLDTNRHLFSGLAIANPQNNVVEIQYALYDTQGNLKGQTNQFLGSRNHVARLAEEIFPFQNLKEFTGMVTVFSLGGPVVATTLRFDKDVGTLASVPVTTGLPIVFIGKNNFYTRDSIVGNLRWMPGGTFRQGTLLQEPGRDPDEGPLFQHNLSKDLAVMETEVTRRMWAELKAKQESLPEDPTHFTAAGPEGPVDRVTWPEALLFANLLSRQQGLKQVYYADADLSTPIDFTNYRKGNPFPDWAAGGYRLPTEGEWEYFTRAGTTGPFSTAEPAYNTKVRNSCADGVLTALESVAWYCANAGTRTHEAGAKAANPWNLKDVHGNVLEWCWDWYADHYPDDTRTDYRGPDSGTHRVLRSGSWGNSPRNMRSGSRFSGDPTIASYHIGFRLVRSM